MENATFTIATIGLGADERRWLQQIVETSQTQGLRFVPYVGSPGTAPDIVIIDSDTPQALQSWTGCLKAKAQGKTISGIVLARERPADNPKYLIQRPASATRLLAMLEKVAIEEHGAPCDAASVSSVSAEDTITYAAAGKRGAQGLPGVKALIVDASFPVRTQLKNAIKSIASHIDLAQTGDEAIEFINNKRYDIIFLDVMLPGIDGYEICRMVKRDPKKQTTPVVMLVADASPAETIRGKLALSSCDAFVAKPMQPAVIDDVVKKLLHISTPA
ncbi:MAG: response regulator [Gammaproteobacteria bacterium]